MAPLLIAQVASQRTWPNVGDIDDCWVLAWQMAQIAVAPWLPWLDATTARRYAGDPDDGDADGNAQGVDDMIAGIRAATPALAALCVPLRGSWSFDQLLPEVKSGRPFAAAVMGGTLPKVYTRVPHQVVIFHEPGVGLRCADPMAPDRSEPYRIATEAARRAIEAFAGVGKVHGVLFPTVVAAFRTHPLYVAPTAGEYTQAQLDAAIAQHVRLATEPLIGKIQRAKAIGRDAADAIDRL